MFSLSLNAQSALKKAESYAKMDAPFLSIKYLQKHIRKQKEDRSAMRLLANTYLQVNMAPQGQKWLLKANNSPAVFSYFQKRNSIKAAQKKMEIRSDKEIIPKTDELICLEDEAVTVVIEDQLLFVAAIGALGSII
jgi:hypothetical protein